MGNATSNYVFLVDGAAVATNAVSSGQVTFAASFLTACSHTIIAQYTGDERLLKNKPSELVRLAAERGLQARRRLNSLDCC